MAGHRFEIGEGVVHIEKRFPNAERRTALMVVDRLLDAGEPRYQLSGPEGLALCVLAESELGPAPPAHEAAREALRLEAPAPADPVRDGGPWPA